MHDTAVLDRKPVPISLGVGRDNSECPGLNICPEWHQHKHCALCAFALVAQGDGYGNIEGFGPDATAVECDECERYSCPECARDRAGKTLCYDCCVRPYLSAAAHATEAKTDEENLVVHNMLDAARDLKLAGQRLARETDPEKIATAVAALVDVQREAAFCASVLAWVRVRAAA